MPAANVDMMDLVSRLDKRFTRTILAGLAMAANVANYKSNLDGDEYVKDCDLYDMFAIRSIEMADALLARINNELVQE